MQKKKKKKNVTVTLNGCHVTYNSVIFTKSIPADREFYAVSENIRFSVLLNTSSYKKEEFMIFCDSLNFKSRLTPFYKSTYCAYAL